MYKKYILLWIVGIIIGGSWLAFTANLDGKRAIAVASYEADCAEAHIDIMAYYYQNGAYPNCK